MSPEELTRAGLIEVSPGVWKRHLKANLHVAAIVHAPDAVEEEDKLHYDILDWCREKGWVALHGSMAHKTYRTKGELDFTIAAPNGRVFFIECKDREGKLSVDQQAMIAHLKKLGQSWAVVRSKSEFLEAVRLQ